ncbi:acyl-CoA dehydrogenase family protein [Aeromicrobium yanjiei]|uniref:Acyl-CoA dehydrogenase n=1 Tax=Aeromicrobium yanjiei TaxID=2662028 RepID=A0A5Q2MKN0_9ACTN|nr:acyl-CoA dehydrogenase family protein [Aeromicrobium yanjiei]QGG41592.1 acyl-CoA dehydrogenase [Aeromicrobium yanjiei]
MDLLLDAQQAAIADTARHLIEKSAPRDRLRDLADDQPVTDTEFWATAAQNGFFSLDLPEELGGTGLGLAEVTLVFREIGRGLVPGPFLGTALALQIARAAGRLDLVEEISTGGRPVGLIERIGDGLFRTLDAGEATTWVVADGTSALYESSAVSTVETKECVDPGSRLAHLRITGEPLVEVALAELDGNAYLSILVAAMLSGSAEATCAMSASYTAVREQFGVPIGSFQAVKHRCADMAVRAEAATQLVTLAALAHGGGRSDEVLLGHAALSIGRDHAIRNAGDNIQNHGGLGLTTEQDASLYLKRTQVWSTIGSPPAELREAILAAPSERPA